MTAVGFGPFFTDSPYLPPEPDYNSTPEKFQELQILRERLTASILNIKENAQYEKRELLTGQQWFSFLQGGVIITNYTFRLTFDLVSLNGGAITPGTTTITLPTDPTVNNPVTIKYANGLTPVHGFGAATAGTTYYFINDPEVYVRFTNTSDTVQTITIVNSTGSNLTQCFWVMEYIKF
jgi:hypothetical protein